MLPSLLDIPVVFEDADILVLDKPVGVSVVEGDDSERQTVVEWVRKRLDLKPSTTGAEDSFEQRGGIVHRIDKETSGILLIAKNRETFDYLKGLFKFRRINKEYQALVYGEISDERFEITAPISRDKNTGVSFLVDEEGRESSTGFLVLRRLVLQGSDYTYLKCYPKTGRTHQIRVHLRAFGHPVVNDAKYANRVLLNNSLDIFERMMLHAKHVDFIDSSGCSRVFESKKSLEEFIPLGR